MLLKKLKKITNKDQHKSFLLLQILISISAILEVISIFSVLPFVTFIMGVETIDVEKYLYFYLEGCLEFAFLIFQQSERSLAQVFFLNFLKKACNSICNLIH